MKVVGVVVSETGIGIALQGVMHEEDKRIRQLRDQIAGALWLRHPGHDTYKFHASLAYFVQNLESNEREELKGGLERELAQRSLMFDLASAEFCLFKDMSHFDRQFYIE